MYALDSDFLSALLRGQTAAVRKALSVPSAQIWLPVVVVEEQMRGRLAVLAGLHLEPPDRVAHAYSLFRETFAALQKFQILDHGEEAEALYQSWPAKVKKIGTRDCRIAASAITNGLTIVTRNRQDFEQIPGAKIEDRSV